MSNETEQEQKAVVSVASQNNVKTPSLVIAQGEQKDTDEKDAVVRLAVSGPLWVTEFRTLSDPDDEESSTLVIDRAGTEVPRERVADLQKQAAQGGVILTEQDN